MKEIRLLDCTLRDGGFVNNWRFGEDCITDIITRLDRAHVDIIEVGYLRSKVEYDVDETQFPHTKYIERIMPRTFENKPMVVAIIDYGDCDLDCVQPCEQTPLDGIRVTIKKKDLDAGLAYCEEIKKLGYKVFAQPVSFMDYSYQDILELVEKINKLQPYAVAIVDTYGFMNQRDLIHRVNIMDDTLDPSIVLGYHSHNNFQLAYSNAVAMTQVPTQRPMIIDASVMGMGKGAGNANTELMALHLNTYHNKQYSIEQLMEIADVYIEKERKSNYWGYSLKHYLAAANRCHHMYIDFLLQKKTLSIHAVDEIVSAIEEGKRTSFNKEYIARLYDEYQAQHVDDAAARNSLQEKLENKSVLVIAPGSSIVREEKKIREYIDRENPVVIAVNFIPNTYSAEYIFVSNMKRYGQVAVKKSQKAPHAGLIVTSNVSTTDAEADYLLNYANLLYDNPQIRDNSTLLLLKALSQMNVGKVALAGFDGYEAGNNNYARNMLEFVPADDAASKNLAVSKEVEKLNEVMQLHFVTSSKYV